MSDYGMRWTRAHHQEQADDHWTSSRLSFCLSAASSFAVGMVTFPFYNDILSPAWFWFTVVSLVIFLVAIWFILFGSSKTEKPPALPKAQRRKVQRLLLVAALGSGAVMLAMWLLARKQNWGMDDLIGLADRAVCDTAGLHEAVIEWIDCPAATMWALSSAASFALVFIVSEVVQIFDHRSRL